MRNLLFGALIGALLTTAGHVLLRDRSGGDEVQRPAEAGEGDSPRESREARRAGEVRSDSEDASIRPTSPIVAAIEALRPPERSPGTGEVSGRIKDETGVGVADVSIAVRPRRPAATVVEGEEEISAWVERVVGAELLERRERRVAISDAAGEFRIAGLEPDLVYEVKPLRRGWTLRRDGPGGLRVRAGEELSFLASRVGLATVRVELPDGTAPERAMIHLLQANANYSMPWEPPSRELECKPAPAQLMATAPGFRSSFESLDLTGGEGEIVLRLRPKPRLSGRVVFEGAGPKHLDVRVAVLDEDEVADSALLLARGEPVWAPATAGYRFEVENVIAGRYALQAFDQKNRPITDLALVRTTIDDPAHVELAALPVDERTHTAVRIIDAEGNPVIGGRVGVVRITGDMHDSRWVESSADAEGRIWVDRRGDRSAPSGSRFMLEIESLAHGTATHPLPLEAQEVVVRLQPPAWLEVTLEGAPLSALANIGLSVRRPESRPGPAGAQLILPEARGSRRRLGPLQPGPAFVSGFDRFFLLFERPVSLAEGENTVRITVPALHRLEVRSTLADGTSLSLERLDLPPGVKARKSGRLQSGRVLFADLPAGRYRLGGGDALPPVEIEIPAVSRLEVGPR